jgi:hypothetical protein
LSRGGGQHGIRHSKYKRAKSYDGNSHRPPFVSAARQHVRLDICVALN